MSVADVSHEAWLSRLVDHLQKERYHSHVAHHYAEVARRFLVHLEKCGTRVEVAQPSDVTRYLRCERQRYRQRHRDRPTTGVTTWRHSHAGGLQMLLRMVHGQWPPPSRLSTARDRFQSSLIEEYTAWMQSCRGLAAETQADRCAEARRFLAWLGPRGRDTQLRHLGVANLDAYVNSRAPSLRRVTLQGVIVRLRDFLRYLHATARTSRDLSVVLDGPRVYADEEIPSILRAEDVACVLEVLRADPSALGRRDYAIVLLLARYGVRAGEVTALRLEDLDWRHDRVRIRHTKTGAHSDLPLLSEVGEALVGYLRHGRPQVPYREVFIRGRAPYRPFHTGSSLYTRIRRHLETAGLTLPGKKGPHTFRHARAVTLLRAGVPPKQIGDILGHRSAASTSVYLKLATADLRAISLDIPTEVTA